MSKAFPSVLISVVVARKDNKFCVTDERWGWYLPAGRVDFGECFTTAGVRESMEEAGLDAVLDGIYRFEFSVDRGFIRFRVVFAAHQRDETKSLKTEADDETYGAEWFTLDEVVALRKGDKAMLAKINAIPRIKALKAKGERPEEEKTRGKEMIHMFHWAEQGTKVFDSRLYYGKDGDEIDNSIVEVSTEYTIVLQIQAVNHTNQYAVKVIPLTKFSDFTDSAEKECKKILKKEGKNINNMKLDTFGGIHHIAPETKKSRARMTLFYNVQVDIKSLKSSKLKFAEATEYVKDDVTEEIKFGMQNVIDGINAPLDMLAWEGSEHIVLT